MDAPTVNAALSRDFPGLDFSEVLAEPLHVVLMDEESGAAFLFRGPGIYEAHVFFAVRGRAALNLFADMLDFMRLRGAKMFWAMVPLEDRRARMFTRLSGWKSLGPRETMHGTSELFVLET